MSRKKKRAKSKEKKLAKLAAKQAATKKSGKKKKGGAGKGAKKAGAAARRVAPRAVAVAATRRTAQATIFLYAADGRTKVRTSPQFLPAGPGYIEWTVVDLTGSDAPVEITWPEGGPWGGEPIAIPTKEGYVRLSLDAAKDGRYKYTVTAAGYSEDPEVEIPEI